MDNLITVRRRRRRTELLPMQGTDRGGNLYQVDNLSLLKNGRRFLPVMGEFHFSRYEKEDWEEELLKMRAGGVDIVATYVFWIHHEERRGEWDFTGCRDLHAFLEVCRRLQMPVWLRIGPWAHGECRNGGFPDWVAAGEWKVRTDDPDYLELVRAFYQKIGEQAAGELCRDGGPVLGIQIENEYGHCGGPSDVAEGLAHMRTLKRLAAGAGLTAPYYTATGWGGACVVDEEMLPVLGGYVDAPWDCSVGELAASENFLFTAFHQDERIGSDLKTEEESRRGGDVAEECQTCGTEKTEPERLTYDPFRSPYLTAELGGGLQVTSHRRTYPWPEDIEAQALCMLGSGANLLGYYMYHGGINPDGRDSTLQESRASGYSNDLPVKSYDFQTCIRETGELGASYGRLKKLHLFLKDFGELLAGSETYFADLQPESAEDLGTLRVSARIHFGAGAGFLFINNHQRKRRMRDREDATVCLRFEEDGRELELMLPHLSVRDGECAVMPFLLPEAQSLAEAAGDQTQVSWTPQCSKEAAEERTVLPARTNVSLLCRIGTRTFYYAGAGCTPYFDWADEPGDVVVLSREQADRAFRVQDRLYITEHSDSCVFAQDGRLCLLTKDLRETLTVYGESGEPGKLAASAEAAAFPGQMEAGFTFLGERKCEDGSTAYREYCVRLKYPKQMESASDAATLRAGAADSLATCAGVADSLATRTGAAESPISRAGVAENVALVHRMYLAVDYVGDRAEVWLAGRLVDDWFTTGEEWHLALKRLGYPEQLTLRIYPDDKPIPNPYGNKVYYDLPVEKGCALRAVRLLPEYRICF